MLPPSARKRLLDFLGDDWNKGDVTAHLIEEKQCAAEITSKEECLLAGVEEAVFLFEREGVKAKIIVKDGSRLKSKARVLSLDGSNHAILAVARTALNVLGRMSGVATGCANAREVVEGASPETRVAMTRKVLPGWGYFDKKAAVLAGVDPHRLDLSDMVLLKDYYYSFFPTLVEAIADARRKTSFTKKIEAEAKTLEQALELAGASPDVLMLDNFTVADAKNAIPSVRKSGFKGLIELSGGITPENLRDYAFLKPDVISMGSLTHSVKSTDFSLRIL